MYEMQAPILQLTDKQTTQSTEEPIHRLQHLERHFSELAQREKRADDSSELLESKDLLEELNSVKETLKREMAISKGLRRTIEKLQEENQRLGKTKEHERADEIDTRKDINLELTDQMKTRDEESKVMKGNILELREKVHELEKENKSLQQKLAKKDKELERFQEDQTGNLVV